MRSITEEQLTEILHNHNRFKVSGGIEGARADLREVDLSRMDLGKANLEGADLRGVDLTRTNMQGASSIDAAR